MRGESGQASVEWIGLVVLVAVVLAAVVRFAPRADADALGPELLHAIGCAARGGCETAPSGKPAHGMVSVPPLVPIAPRERPAHGRPGPAARWRAVGERLFRGRALPRGRALVRRAGRGAGLLYRRSWIFCLGYERARYGFLHPEVRFPLMPIPYSEDLRMANDCISPVDLVRDWDLIRGPR
jgi:hypothetical protein